MRKSSKGFLWGETTAANQIGGGYNKGGKGISISSCAKMKRGISVKDYHKLNEVIIRNIGKASESSQNTVDYPKRYGNDFYHHYKQDIVPLAEMEFKVFRMSIARSRIFPNSDELYLNKEGLKFYDNMFDELPAHGIQPLVTMSHYEPPIHLVLKYNDWYAGELVSFFERYVNVICEQYKNRVKYWITFNEIDSIIRHPYTTGGLVEGRFAGMNFEEVYYQAMHHRPVASASATKICHEIVPNTGVDCMIAKLSFYPMTCKPEDILESQKRTHNIYAYSDVQIFGEYPLYLLKYYGNHGTHIEKQEGDGEIMKNYPVDFVPFSYYMSSCVAADGDDSERITGNTVMALGNPYLPSSEWGRQIDPIGLRVSPIELYDRYRKLLFIVGNGLGAEDALVNGKIHDTYRIEYYRQYLQCMYDAIAEDDVDLMGYTSWACIDLINESTKQISKRYGLIYMDADDDGKGTCDRYRRDSFCWYRKVIRNNSVDFEQNKIYVMYIVKATGAETEVSRECT